MIVARLHMCSIFAAVKIRFFFVEKIKAEIFPPFKIILTKSIYYLTQYY